MMKKLYLLIIVLIIPQYFAFSQILYNIDKPPSYFQDGLKEHSELPTVHFKTNEFGNVIENNINYNIIENSNVELLQNQYIVRMKVKIFAEKLGMMSIIMDKIELKNNSYC